MKKFNVEIEDNAIIGELLVKLGVDQERANRVVAGMDAMESAREDLERIGVSMTFSVSIEAPDVLRQAQEIANSADA